MIPLPRLNANSIFGYLGLAVGLAAGFSLWQSIGDRVQSSLAKNGSNSR